MNIPYRTNNVEFRIASADAIGKFKETQANVFLQMCRKEFDFNVSAREIVLLSYDRFSTWIFRIERGFLAEDQKRLPTRAALDITISSFIEELSKIEETCELNPKIFEPSIVEFMKVIHSYSAKVFAEAIARESKTRGAARVFTGIINILSDYLQHILVAMHEYNNNLTLKRAPFLCVTHFSLSAHNEKCAPMLARARFFSSKIAITSATLKNYTSAGDINSCIEALERMGISTLPELEMSA